MSRASATLLVITADFIARADVSSQASVLNVWKQARAAETPLEESVNSAIRLGPRPARTVWVLCEDAWTQMLALPHGAVGGLSDADLARAFSFESEPLSGISSSNAALGFIRAEKTEDLQAFWITVLDSATRTAIQRSVRASGAKLAGIVHPAGVPVPIASSESGVNWRRVETWKQMTLCVTAEGQKPSRVQILNASSQPRVQASVSSFMLNALAGHAEFLDSSASPRSGELSGGSRLQLSNDADFRKWIEAWARQLTTQSSSCPVIAPEATRTAPATYAFASVALALLAFAGCYMDYRMTSNRIETLREESAALSKPGAQIAKVEKTVRARTEELRELREKRVRAEAESVSRTTSMKIQQQRVFTLLERLALDRPEDVVVLAIASKPEGSVEVRGLSIQAQDADELAARLSHSLKQSQWIVEPLGKKAKQLLDGGGPWEFTLSVRRAGTPAPRKSAPVESARLPEPGRMEAQR
ncbi:MAG TPA: hypothetical protein VEJ63_11760 [Planctomycetota bacterium]|nr:hypothetical protein [Planctomycetota bacterium]